MPVSVLYCEGKANGPDVQVISRIIDVPGCSVTAAGGHRDIVQRIPTSPGLCALGLRDRDQQANSFIPTQSPPAWYVGETMIGWYWERVELENYLLDPEIVARTVGQHNASFDLIMYRQALIEAAQAITDYAAARKAITDCLPTPFPPAVYNCWGPKRGGENHPLPDVRTEAACRTHIQETMTQHRAAHENFEMHVMQRYDELLPEYRSGAAFVNFLTYFSGKDLLWMMEEPLRQMGFNNPTQFRDNIVTRIANSAEDVYTWLPEWQALRRLVAEYH